MSGVDRSEDWWVRFVDLWSDLNWTGLAWLKLQTSNYSGWIRLPTTFHSHVWSDMISNSTRLMPKWQWQQLCKSLIDSDPIYKYQMIIIKVKLGKLIRLVSDAIPGSGFAPVYSSDQPFHFPHERQEREKLNGMEWKGMKSLLWRISGDPTSIFCNRSRTFWLKLKLIISEQLISLHRFVSISTDSFVVSGSGTFGLCFVQLWLWPTTDKLKNEDFDEIK